MLLIIAVLLYVVRIPSDIARYCDVQINYIVLTVRVMSGSHEKNECSNAK